MTETLLAPAVDYSATASEAYRAALAVIETVEPRIADATRAELADQRVVAQADRLGKLRLAGRAVDHGQLAQ